MLIRSFLVMLVIFGGLSLGDAPVVSSYAFAEEAEKHDGEKDGDHKHEKGHDDHDHGDGHTPLSEKGVGTGLIPGQPDENGNVSPWRTDLSIYSLIVFLVLLAIMTKFAWGPIIEALDAREENIRKNIDHAEQLRQDSEALLAQHAKKLDAAQDEVREIIAEAKRDAEHTKKEIEAKAQDEAKLTQDRAVEEINRARDQALNDLFDSMSSQVTTATEQVIGRSLTDEDRERLVTDAISQFSS